MDVWVYISWTLGALIVLIILFFGVDFIGKLLIRRQQRMSKSALDKYWDDNKETMSKNFPCPNCEGAFDVPEQTYFECPHCGHVLTLDWAKSFRHRQIKEQWENSFHGNVYKIAPELRSKDGKRISEL